MSDSLTLTKKLRSCSRQISMVAIHRQLLIAIAFTVLALVASINHANQSFCDDSIKPADNQLGYRWRAQSGICEGFYEARVSASMDVVSYLAEELRFDPTTQDKLYISAPDTTALTSGPVSVRAVALPPGTYYRMDTALTQEQVVTWLLNEVVVPARIRAGMLGLFGWIGDGPTEIFVPLYIDSDSNNRQASGSRKLELLLRPSVDIDNARWRGWVGEEIVAQGEVSRGVRAGSPFLVAIERGSPAVIDIEVIAKASNLDTWISKRLRALRIEE